MPSPTRILYWFRNDLRLHDNPAFATACTDAPEVVPVYVFDPTQFRELPTLGIRKTGVFRTKFLIECVADLRASLRARGADLIIRVGDPARILADMAEEINASAVYASKEVTSEETDAESALSKRLKPLNVDIELFWGSTLYHIRDLPFGIAKLPEIFTQFRSSVEQYTPVRDLESTPDQVRMPSGIDAGDLPTLAQFGFTDELPADERVAVRFTGGETVALARVKHYLWTTDLIRTYKETRNGLLGEDYSSKFSAWLACGCLSPRFIYHEVKRYELERGANDSTYWLIFELIWRDFFRFVALRFGTRLFKPSGIKHDLQKQWRRDHDLFQRWATGKTGIPFIDANMCELNTSGFMSNRGRQNVASFLVNDLGIDWTWGATYFESLLIDYDPCSNWGNWNYLAGVGNDPRQNRYFNIYSQATRYDEQGSYVKHWLPEIADAPADNVHLVWTLDQQQQNEYGIALGDTYPMPVIDPGRWLLKQ